MNVELTDYSSRNATTGSIRVARRAGNSEAIKPTAPRISTTNAIGSGDNLNSSTPAPGMLAGMLRIA